MHGNEFIPHTNRRLSTRGLAKIIGIDKECIRQILHELFNMRKVCANMVPKLLISEQKDSRKNICTDCSRLVRHGSDGQSTLFIEVLMALRERVRRRRPDLWKTKSWKIHQDNAPVHSTTLSVKAFLAKCGITVLEHPPYSPDLAIFLFPKVKSALKGTRF
ncbi:hypothetical protein NQ318_014646 [Aromia moschata]|uniref:Transposase n=1 Tax=Aromia moschata TaxID=1265417 RepID=A0AAV8ZAL8_9CUCU|nr:hypothetical protein NQ318_014646 [Aromia moschata]